MHANDAYLHIGGGDGMLVPTRYAAFELCSGGALWEYVRVCPAVGDAESIAPFPEPIARYYFRQVRTTSGRSGGPTAESTYQLATKRAARTVRGALTAILRHGCSRW